MITLRQAKNYLNINNNIDDEFIKDLYNLAIGHINGYCNRDFEEQEYTEVLQGNNRAYLKTGVTPLNSIEELKINKEVIDSGEYKIKNKMIFYPKLFPAKYGVIDGKISAYNREYNVEVIYVAGYTFPQWTDVVNSSNVPKDLQYVCLELIKKMYIQSGVCAQEQTHTVSTGGESVARQYFKQEIKDLFSTDIKAILNRYR